MKLSPKDVALLHGSIHFGNAPWRVCFATFRCPGEPVILQPVE
jgi:hypothetical protein